MRASFVLLTEEGAFSNPLVEMKKINGCERPSAGSLVICSNISYSNMIKSASARRFFKWW